MIRERERNGLPGIPVLLLLFLSIAATVWMFVYGAGAPDGRPDAPNPLLMVPAVLLFVFEIFLLTGLFVVAPNSARVLQLFGDYVGTAKSPGLHWANPFYTKKRLSLRVRNFESSHLKVNDAEGNPIEIAAVVVWRVVETAEDMLSHKGIVQLDEERKAAMVSNLLVVLCGEKGAQPILNTGTIHQ